MPPSAVNSTASHRRRSCRCKPLACWHRFCTMFLVCDVEVTTIRPLMAISLMSNIKEKVTDAAKTVGHKVAEAAASTVDFVKEKTGMGGCAEGTDIGRSGISEHMQVIASCGKQVGIVDRVEGAAIKLTKNDSPH